MIVKSTKAGDIKERIGSLNFDLMNDFNNKQL